MAEGPEDGGAGAQSAGREQPQRQAKAAPPSNAAGQQGQPSAASAAAGPSSSKRSNSNGNGPESGSSSNANSLESIDGIVQAIQQIPVIANGDANMQYKLIRENLLPGITQLENKGTAAGVPGRMILQSPLTGNIDPLYVLMQQPELTGNGVGFLSILLARCQVDNPNPHHLVPLIIQFCQIADHHQLLLVPQKVNLLAIWLAHFCREQPDVCIDPIYTLMRRFQGSHCGLYLTALQPIILHASLRANNYVRARYMLSNHPVMEVDARTFPVQYHDNLKYHLYAGSVAAVLGDYGLAIELLETAVSAPSQTNATSLIQLDAYKRLVLVQLIHHGKTTSPPAYTSSNVTQTFRQLCSIYSDFARDYESLSRAKCYAYLADSKRSTFETDGTLGLVERALGALPSRAILDLQKVYKTIEIGEVAHIVFSDDAGSSSSAEASAAPRPASAEHAKAFVEVEIQRLVAQRKLSARIVPSASDPNLRYLEFLPTISNSRDSAIALERALQNISDSTWTLKNLDARISGSRDFLKKAYETVPKNGMGHGGAPGHGPGGMDVFDLANDEELMDRMTGAYDD